MNPIIGYENFLELFKSTLTVTSEAAGFPKTNLYDFKPYTYWKPTGTGTQDIAIDAGAARSADYLAVIGHDLFTRGATLTVQSDTTAGFPAPTTRATWVADTNKAAFIPFASDSARYWRVRITGLTGVPFIGQLNLGLRLTMPRNADNGYDRYSKRTFGQIFVSESGQFLGASKKYKQIEQSPVFQWLDKTWAETYLLPFLEDYYTEYKSFFYVPDYDEAPALVYFLHAPAEARVDIPQISIFRNWTMTALGVAE